MQVLFTISDIGKELVLSSLKMQTLVSPGCREGLLLHWDVVVGKIGNFVVGYGMALVYMLDYFFMLFCFCKREP